MVQQSTAARQATPALVSCSWLASRLAPAASSSGGSPRKLRLLDANAYPASAAGAAFAAATRIPGARHFSVPDCSRRDSGLSNTLPPAAQFAEYVGRQLGIGNDAHVVVYDNCMFAPRVWWMFRLFGHDAVSVLDGGLATWVAEGRPVKTGPPATAFPAVEFRASEADNKARLYRSLEEFCRALRTPSVQVADARSPRRFHGEDPEPRPGLPGGHAVGSANLFYRSLYDPATGCLLPTDQLRKRFHASGLDPSRQLVATCGSGITACHVALAAHALGNTEAAVFDGSWEEFATAGPAELRAAGPAERES